MGSTPSIWNTGMSARTRRATSSWLERLMSSKSAERMPEMSMRRRANWARDISELSLFSASFIR